MIILSSMMLLAFLLISCDEEEGCLSVEKGTIPWKQQQTATIVPYTSTTVNCDGIAEEYDGYYGEFSYAEIVADINSRLRIKLIHDGNEPSWVPETITVGQLIGCEYTTRPAPSTKCGQRAPVLYYGAAEATSITSLTLPLNLYLDIYGDYFTYFSVVLSSGNNFGIELDTPETGKHQAYYKKDPNKDELTYFYYENQ